MPEIKELLGKESLLAIKDYVDTKDSGKEDKENKTTILSDTSIDAQYPSAKAVVNYVDKNIIDRISLLNNQSQLSGGTYPRLLKYNENKLYLFLDNRYRVSNDGGKTWSEPVILFTTSTETQESGQTINDVGNAYAFLSPNNDGRIVVLYRSLNRNTPYFSICAKVSDTNGENFGARQELFHSQAGYWEPFYYKGWIYYSAEHGGSGADKAQSIYRRTLSVDSNGAVGVGSSTMFIDGRNKVDTDGNINTKSRIGMISASSLVGGDIFVFESSVNINASTPRPMVIQYCYDGPTPVKNLFLGSSGKKCGAPFVTTLDDGRVVISFQTNENYTGYDRTDFRNCQFVAFVSKRKVNYGDELTTDDFVKLTTYEYGENEYGVWGSVSNIDGILYKAFSIGVNKSTTTNTAYGNLVQKCFLPFNIPVSLTTTTGSETITVNSDSLNVVTRDTEQTITAAKYTDALMPRTTGRNIGASTNRYNAVFAKYLNAETSLTTPSITYGTNSIAVANIASKDYVQANPETTTDTLSALTINNTNYKIKGVDLDVTVGSESISDGTNTINVVTRDTAQVITEDKTFKGNNLYFQTSTGTETNAYIEKNSTYDLGIHAPYLLYFGNCIRPENGGSLGASNRIWSNAYVQNFRGRNLYLSNCLINGDSSSFGIRIPSTVSYTADKTLATTDEIPQVKRYI